MKKMNIDINDILELHNSGLTDKEIANVFGCTRHNITSRLNKIGVTGRKSKINNIKLRNKISKSLMGRYCGKENPNYKGYTDEKTIARGVFKAISKRLIRNSNYICSICGKRGGDLETHHIKPFKIIFDEFIQTSYSGNIEFIYDEIIKYKDFTDENNLIVVCKKCHHDIHYSDNTELSPYRWESVTTISKESTSQALGDGSAQAPK